MIVAVAGQLHEESLERLGTRLDILSVVEVQFKGVVGDGDIAETDDVHIEDVVRIGILIFITADDRLRVFDKDKVAYTEEIIDCSKAYVSDGGDNSVAGHYGGDHFLMRDAVRYFNGISESLSVTKIEDSLNGHYICYAAELSRKANKIVDLAELKG